jgi:hypothetical protein
LGLFGARECNINEVNEVTLELTDSNISSFPSRIQPLERLSKEELLQYRFKKPGVPRGSIGQVALPYSHTIKNGEGELRKYNRVNSASKMEKIQMRVECPER